MLKYVETGKRGPGLFTPFNQHAGCSVQTMKCRDAGNEVSDAQKRAPEPLFNMCPLMLYTIRLICVID